MLGELLDKAARLLDDVSPEFQSFSQVVENIFHRWSQHQEKDYDMAYGTLSLPGVAELFVRLEMLEWAGFEVRRHDDSSSLLRHWKNTIGIVWW